MLSSLLLLLLLSFSVTSPSSSSSSSVLSRLFLVLVALREPLVCCVPPACQPLPVVVVWACCRGPVLAGRPKPVNRSSTTPFPPLSSPILCSSAATFLLLLLLLLLTGAGGAVRLSRFKMPADFAVVAPKAGALVTAVAAELLLLLVAPVPTACPLLVAARRAAVRDV
jgi:hypothetical protein